MALAGPKTKWQTSFRKPTSLEKNTHNSIIDKIPALRNFFLCWFYACLGEVSDPAIVTLDLSLWCGAVAMNDIVQTIINLSPMPGTPNTAEPLGKLSKFLNDKQKDIKKSPGSIDQIVDQVLQLPQHTLGILHLL